MNKKLLNNINKMFESCGYTDHGRIVIEYSKILNAVIISVVGNEPVIIYCNDLTEYGVLMNTLNAVRVLYES